MVKVFWRKMSKKFRRNSLISQLCVCRVCRVFEWALRNCLGTRKTVLALWGTFWRDDPTTLSRLIARKVKSAKWILPKLCQHRSKTKINFQISGQIFWDILGHFTFLAISPLKMIGSVPQKVPHIANTVSHALNKFRSSHSKTRHTRHTQSWKMSEFWRFCGDIFGQKTFTIG